MKLLKAVHHPLLYLLVSLVLSACATQLAPRYDQTLYDGLTQTNTEIMELFASISAGTSAETFSEREEKYNAIIGSIDALAMQSRARPVPENKISEKVNAYLDSRGVGALSDGEAPSASSLDEVSENLVKMRDKDKVDGLKPGAIAVFKNAIVISMDQALTYEAFLER
jgi:hypothetical protein